MVNKEKYHGVVAPLMTPLAAPAELDADGYVHMIRHVVDAGVHGIFPMASSGEALHNSYQVWQQANRLALENVEKDYPVYSGAISPSTAGAIENVKYLESIGARVAVVTAPFYTAGIYQSELLRHFEAILENTEIEICVYNIPSLTGGNNIEPETIERLSKHPKVVAYKDSCPDFNHHQRTLLALREQDISVLCGGEELCCASILFGSQGNISGLATSFPKLFIQAYEAALRMDVPKVREYQERILGLKDCIRVGPTDCSCMKFVLSMIGIGTEQNCYHTEPLSEEQKEQVRKIAGKYLMYV